MKTTFRGQYVSYMEVRMCIHPVNLLTVVEPSHYLLHISYVTHWYQNLDVNLEYYVRVIELLFTHVLYNFIFILRLFLFLSETKTVYICTLSTRHALTSAVHMLATCVSIIGVGVIVFYM